MEDKLTLAAIALLLLLTGTARAQDAIAYHVSEPDAAEGTRLHTAFEQAKQAFERWKSTMNAKYSSAGKPLAFTFDFRIAVPKPEDQKDSANRSGSPPTSGDISVSEGPAFLSTAPSDETQ